MRVQSGSRWALFSGGTSVPGPERLNYSFGEKLGYFVARYTGESLCDSFTAFQKQDYGIFFSLSLPFYLARQPSKWKVFLTSSLLLTLQLYLTSHLFLQSPSVSFLQRRLFISRLTIGVGWGGGGEGAWFGLMCWGGSLMSQSGIRDTRGHLCTAWSNF